MPDIITIVLDSLPEELLKDSLFAEIRKNINISPDSFLIGNIAVDEETYLKVASSTPNASNYVDISNKRKILRLAFLGDYMYILDIIKFGDIYEITFKRSNTNNYLEINLEVDEGVRRIEAVTTKQKDNLWQDFMCDIRYYDECDTKLDIDTEKEKDEVFSEKFYIPLELASLFRHNFQALKKEINLFYAKKDMELTDDFLGAEEGFLFKEPLNLENLSSILLKNYHLDSEVLSLISKIATNLLEIIGPGEVVFTSNILENLDNVIYGICPAIVYTRGFILKKLKNSYILYYCMLENTSVSVIPEEITKEEAEKLFISNEHNWEVSGLKEFFAISRGKAL